MDKQSCMMERVRVHACIRACVCACVRVREDRVPAPAPTWQKNLKQGFDFL